MIDRTDRADGRGQVAKESSLDPSTPRPLDPSDARPLVPFLVDERREARSLLGMLEVRSWRQGAQAAVAAGVAAAIAYVPAHAGLTRPGRHALFVLLFAAALWVTEAIPAFAVALLVMGLEIVLLGDLGRTGEGAAGWERFVAPWASPIVWLFLGGLVLGRAATKTGFDRALATRVLAIAGPSPARSLFGLMAVAFLLSMFMSNTAATAMLVAVATPVVAALPAGEPFRKALVLGVPVAANLGGMGTLIGSPPNAIAGGALGERAIDFARWMLVGIPPSVALLLATWLFLQRRYPPGVARVAVAVEPAREPLERLPRWRRIVVAGVLVTTVGAWLTSSLHGIPTPVVSFLPITVLAAVGVIRSEDLRGLGWDVLVLLAGGLSLGVAVSETGLADWFVGTLPIGGLGLIGLALAVAYATALLSNFMSNTAAANVLVPVAVALAPSAAPRVAVAVALAASTAMCLPISTPPNAIAFASKELDTRDFVGVGLLTGLLGPVLCVLWAALVLR